MIELLIGLGIGFACGALWMWRLWDGVLREFEEPARPGRPLDPLYRLSRIIKR